jgi:hypothetical protein
MRGIILWAAVGIAAIVTGLGLYATALQTSPGAITNPATTLEPTADVSPLPTWTPIPDDHADREDHEDRAGVDHDED